MKIKTIERKSYFDLENAINKFIKNRTDVVEIKYLGNPYSKSHLNQYSVMIIMKE